MEPDELNTANSTSKKSDSKQPEHTSTKAFPKIKLSQNEIDELIRKITLYLLEQKEISIEAHLKETILSSKDKLKLFKLPLSKNKHKHPEQITDTDCIIHIFTQSSSNSFQLMECLNSLRFQLIIMQIPQFLFIVNIFMKILDRYAHNFKLTDKRLSILDYIIILSQTFYCEKSNPDTIMSNYIGQHAIWQEKIWSSLIERFISKEKKSQKKIGINFNHDRELSIITSTLITYQFIIKSFHKLDGLGVIQKLGRKYHVDIPEIKDLY